MVAIWEVRFLPIPRCFFIILEVVPDTDLGQKIMRITNANARLSKNEKWYAIVALNYDDENVLGVLINVPNVGLFFMCNHEDFHGAFPNNLVGDMGFRQSYYLTTPASNYSFGDVRYPHGSQLVRVLIGALTLHFGEDIGRTALSCLNSNGYLSSRVNATAVDAIDTGAENEADDSISQDPMINDKYENMTYTGQHSYHYHHGRHLNAPMVRFNGHRIGIELEVEFDNSDDRDEFNSIASNWFYRERDGSLGDYGVEIITIPLLPQDAKDEEMWRSLCKRLRKAKSWDTGRCGLHVHIGREILGKNEDVRQETLGRMLYLYHEFLKQTRLNVKIFGRDRGYHDVNGQTLESRAANVLGNGIFKDASIKDKVKQSLIDKGDETRYFDINIQNPATIEFRKGRGSINATRIAMVIEWCEIICKYSRQTPWSQIGYEDFVNYAKIAAKGETLKAYLDSEC